MVNGFHHDGPAWTVDVPTLTLLIEALEHLNDEVMAGKPYLVVTNETQFYRVRALVDSRGWGERVAVAISDNGPKVNTIVAISPPPDFTFPPRRAYRYGSRRCSHCAIRLSWWELPGVERCRDCRPMLRDGAARPPGLNFASGSRWDDR